MEKSDWKLLIQGGEEMIVKEGEVILKEGIYLNRIYQIEKGQCIIQKEIDDKIIVITKLGPKDIFGEMSFLSKNPSSASVVADEGGVTLLMIEGHYINSTFVLKPSMAVNYFSYLAETLSRKLHLTEKKVLIKKDKRKRKRREKESKENEKESKENEKDTKTENE